MKRFTGFLITLAVCIAAGGIFFFAFTRLSNSTRELLLSKIPFFGKKQLVSFSTRTGVLESNGLLSLKTASFDIDFLVHLEHEQGRFIALYPYQVTAGIDLQNTEIYADDNVLHITMNAPQILSSSSSDSSKVLVLRDSLPETFSDYETYFKPVKKAFEQKAFDEAIQHGILEKSSAHAQRFLTSLFSQNTLTFDYKNPSELTSITRIDSPSLPVYFTMSNAWKSGDTVWSVFKPLHLSRDELYISFTGEEESEYGRSSDSFMTFLPKIRFGRVSTNSDETFTSMTESVKKAAGDNEITALFSNPLQSSDSKTVLIADERGYYRSITAFKDGLVSYLETSNVSAQMHIQDYSPLLFYTSMSINFDSTSQSREKKQLNAQSAAYVSLYDKSRTALEKKNFAAVNQYTSVLQTQETKDPDIKMLMSLNDFLYKNILNPTGLQGYETFDDQISAAHVIKTNAIGKLTKENRQKLIGTYLYEKRLKEYFEAYFLKYRTELNLSEEEILLYTDDLIMSGAVITRELFSSLSEERRKRYLENIMLFNADKDSIRIENDGGVSYILCGTAYEKVYAHKNKGPSYIQKQLARTSPVIHPDVILIFPEKKLFTEFSAIAFEKNNVVLFNNITSVLFVNEHLRLPYELVSFYGDNFKIGSFVYTDPLVRSVLYQLNQVYVKEESYALDISGDLSSQLIKTICSIMARPSL